jgi:microcin C transport system substrate-binding protein
MAFTRRDFGRLAAGAGALAVLRPGLAAAQETIVAHGVSAFGDLKYPADFAHFDYATLDVPTGGTHSQGVGGGTFDSLNPFILRGYPASGLGLTHDTLMTRADDEPDAVYGLVAKSCEYPEDRLWCAFDLREEARFADGSPITAEDVVFTFETLRDKGHPSYRVVLAPVVGVTADGPLRVQYEFHPDAPRRGTRHAISAPRRSRSRSPRAPTRSRRARWSPAAPSPTGAAPTTGGGTCR